MQPNYTSYKRIYRLLSAATLTALSAWCLGQSICSAQPFNPSAGQSPSPPPRIDPPAPPPRFDPLPLFPQQPTGPLGGTPPILNPRDVTNADLMGLTEAAAAALPGPEHPPVGIIQLKDAEFSTLAAHQSADGIVVRAAKATKSERPNPYAVKLLSGQVLVCVQHPSHNALVSTRLGDVSISQGADVIVSFNDGVLRVMNLIGHQKTVQAKLDQGPFAGPADPVVTIEPGFELVAGERKLVLTDLRPPDGIGRRNPKLYEHGFLAVSQFSLSNLLSSSELIADMGQQTSGTKETRILADLSKMAAVLNYVNGQGGFVTQAKAP